ncbi:MAG: hypothetical protein ACK5ME_03075 [Parahaliea sp.]
MVDKSDSGASEPVSVMDESLHIFGYHSNRFMIYTNWIEPGVWTRCHKHEHDQVAIIAAGTTVA